MLANELIANAWYHSGVVARQAESVSGTQMQDGLRLLNSLLSMFGVDGKNIPYYKKTSMSLTPGDQDYSIANLIFAETVTFIDGTNRFPMREDTRKEFFGTFRVEGIESMPFHYHCERSLPGLDIYLYFVPDKAYTLEIWGKFALTECDMNTDLSLIVGDYYQTYLEYALTELICGWYGVDMPQIAGKILRNLEQKIEESNPPDLSTQKINILSSCNLNDKQPLFAIMNGAIWNG